MDKLDHLIHELDKARERMRAIVDKIDVEREIYPGWTIKHVLAHVTGWDDAAIASLCAHAGGDEPATPAVRGVDHYNAESVATREALDFGRIVAEWEQARDQLKQTIRALPPEKLDEEMILPWGGQSRVAPFIQVFIDHEHEHADEIAKLLQQ
jgi:uncharacterized protein (TIGR03083 family)